MVARPGEYHANFNGGELAPEIHGRTDIKQYYEGAAEMTNVEPVPQGGFRLMPRSRLMARVRRSLAAVTASGTTDSSGDFSAPGTLFQIDFAAAHDICAVAVRGFSGGEEIEDALQLQYWGGDAAWHDFGAALRLTVETRNRLVAIEPGTSVSASKVRLRLTATPSTEIAIAIDAMEAKEEGDDYGAVRLRPFTFSTSQAYEMVFTAGHVDIFRNGAFVGAAETELDEDEVEALVVEQRFDTALLFHEDVEPRRILRDGADDEWPWDAVPWQDIPEVDYGGAYSDTVDEWTIYVRYPSGTSNGRERVLTLSVNGEESDGVTVADTGTIAGANDAWDDLASQLKTAIEALPSVGAGIAVARVGNAGSTAVKLRVQFSGAANAGSEFVVSAQIVSHTDSSATVGHTVIGAAGGEALISEARGWPACAKFYQDRLMLAGFKSKQAGVVASVIADYYNLNVDIQSGSGALLIGLDTEGAERLQQMARSRHLVLFTSDAEYYISDRQISRATTPTITECSRNGSAATVPIVSSEGELLYVSKNRSVAYAAKYSDISQAYDSEPISLLASHLIDAVNDAALQRAEVESDAARYWLVRDDGAMAVGVLIRNQEIVAFVRWTTDGEVKAACVDGANQPYLVVEREVDGAAARFLERLELGLTLDCATELSFETATDTLTGLDDYEGAEVWAIVDGYAVGPLTVEDGGLALPFAGTGVTVGRWTAPTLRTLPVPRMVEDRIVVARPVRVHTVRASLIDTTSIAIGANDGDPEDVELYATGDPADQALPPYTGAIAVPGLLGFSETGTVEITQVRPGALQLRDLIVEAKV